MMDKENLQLRRLGENDHDAIPFYLKQGFLPLSKSDEDAATRLLYFDLESVKDIKTL